MALLFRRNTPVFFRSTPSFLQHLRYSAPQKVQRKILSTSVLKSRTSGEDVHRQTTQRQSTASVNPREIFVGNLLNISEDALLKYFSHFGDVEVIDYKRGRFKWPKGFAFVTFSDHESAQKVLAETHVIDGDVITVGGDKLKGKNVSFSKGKKDMTVLVTNVGTNISKEQIEKHFSQFGTVDTTILAKEGELLSSYYVKFSSLSAAKRALEEPTQRIADQGIDSQVMELPNTKEFTGTTKRLRLTSVPHDVTVDDLRDYFLKFEDVEYVELFLIVSKYPERNFNFAHVHFSNESTVEEIVQVNNHVINDTKVTVLKQRTLKDIQNNNQHIKVSVEGLPLSTTPQDIRNFFSKTFHIKPIIVSCKWDPINAKKVCVVKLLNKRELEKVLEEINVTFNGAPLYFHQLVWSKEGSDTQP